MLQPYRKLWSTPAVVPALSAVFVSALPIGMAGLAIILSVQQWTGSLQWAGTLAGVFGAGNAVGLLIQGRLLSGRRSANLIMVMGIVSAAGFAGLIMIGYAGGPQLIMIGVVAISGLAVPAITTAVRAWLPGVITDPAGRTAGYALLAVLFQAAVLIGPLLVSLAVAIAMPAAGLGLIAVLMLGSAILFRAAVRSRPAVTRPAEAARSGSRWWRGGLGWLLGINVTVGLAAGITAVAVPGVTSAAGLAFLAGAVASAAALGDVAGALGYAARIWPGRALTRVAVVAGIAALVAAAAWAVAGIPWLLLVTGFGGGLLGAPLGVLLSSLLDRVVPAPDLARGYSTLVCASLLASAAGSGLAAAALPYLGVRGLFLLPPVALLGAVGVALLARRSVPE
ncbi:MFS transporter [Microlunatus parietis]|uniref:MFS family permease n=1 Tax=Microlunatus parietis TaxID=682979 RepID=A0A7Y9L9V5_9ACTN|nr:hypothetical protein [Microlunatus parietis]NYE72194.1 MFS family permease [Microlunatus parietis]